MSEQPSERDIFDFADAINRGEQLAPQTDEEKTYLRVNRAMQASAMPEAERKETWEEIMTTLALPYRPESNRTKRLTGPALTRTSSPRSIIALAVAAALLVASIGMWQGLSGPPPSEPRQAPVVAGLTPDNNIVMQVATPQADANGCVTQGSIPVWQKVPGPEGTGARIWLTPEGAVMYDCGDGNAQEIATGIDHIGPASPGKLNLVPSEYPDKAPLVYDLATGTTVEMDMSSSSYLMSPTGSQDLGVSTVADAPGVWSVVNYTTMQSVSLNDITGGQFPSNTQITAKTSADGSAIAIATGQYETEGSSLLNLQSGLPGEIAVIGADLETVHWVKVPADVPAVNNIVLSPDGTKVVLISSPFNLSGDPTSGMIVVMDVASNTEIARSDAFDSTGPSVNIEWAPDSNGVFIITNQGVSRLALDGSGATVLYESDMFIHLMPRMDGSDFLYLSVAQWPESGETLMPDAAQLVVLDMVSGETQTVDGWAQSIGSSSPETIRVSLSPILVQTDENTIVAYDPLTLEPIDGLTAKPYVNEGTEDNPVMFISYQSHAQSAPVSTLLLGDGTVAIVDYTSGTAAVRTVELPSNLDTGRVELSPDGRHLVVGNAFFATSDTLGYATLDLTDSESEWQERGFKTTLFWVELPGN